MKKARILSKVKRDGTTRTIKKGSSRVVLAAILDNMAASKATDYTNKDLKEYLKSATETGIVNTVKGQAVAGFYMLNVSLENRVLKTGHRTFKTAQKRRVHHKSKKQRSKVRRSSFDQRNHRTTNNELLYI